MGILEATKFKQLNGTLPAAMREDIFDWGRIHGERMFVSLGYWWLCQYNNQGHGVPTKLWDLLDKLVNWGGRRMNISGGWWGFSNEFYFPLYPNGRAAVNRTHGVVVPLLQNRTVYLI